MTEFEPRHELIALRGLAGLTQQQLAERIEGSAEAISNWERGRTVPRPKFRQPLADALGISLPNLEGLFGITLAINPTGHAVQPWLTHYESLSATRGRTVLADLLVGG